MAQMKVPSEEKIFKWSVGTFLGCDLTQESANVDGRRSPDCPNMIRESVGKVRKRTGYTTYKTYPAQINGVHKYNDGTDISFIIHAGTVLYLDAGTGDYTDDTVLYTTAANGFSKSVQINKMLLIVDGYKALLFGKHDGANYSIATVESKAYIPTVTISRAPTGGGTAYEVINLVGSGRRDSFLGEDDVTEYQLSAKNLDDDAVTAQKLNADASYTDLVENTDFTVNRETGVVTFTTAPDSSPITGQDNVIITYYVTVSGYADKINKCDVATLYGANGARDRAFIAGNPALSNQDYYCQMNNPAYWGDLWYTVLGQDNCMIMGYSIISDKLATILNGTEDSTNVVLRTASLDEENQTVFVLSGSFQGVGAVSKNAFGILKTEPMFLSNDGLYAVTPSDVLGERLSQERSYYIRGKLKTIDLSDAYGVAWSDYYCVAVGEYIFLLDGLQSVVEENRPYSTRQYECFYWTGINARVLYTNGEALCFGTADGKLCEFATDYDDPTSYNDNGVAISARWTTPEFYGNDFSYKKRFKRIAVLLSSAIVTSGTITAYYDGESETIIEHSIGAQYFSFQYLTFSQLTFKTDKTPQSVIEKLSIKPDNRNVQFTFENNVKNQAFGLYEAIVEYTESR